MEARRNVQADCTHERCIPHTMQVISIIAKWFSAASLHDTTIESGTIAEESVSSVPEGWHKNREICLGKLLYKALLRIARNNFSRRHEEHHRENLQHMTKTFEAIKTLHADVCGDALNNELMECIGLYVHS